MSLFKTEVVRLTITPHPNADRLEIANFRGYQSVVLKGAFQDGDLAAYIQEASIVPTPLLEELGLTGKLAGSKRDRVKAVRLRGVLSQGICYRARPSWTEGQDVGAELGITKYTPPIPKIMTGSLYHAGTQCTVRYDIENLKRFPDVFEPHELVYVTEKIHGTACCIGVVAPHLTVEDRPRTMISSKGLGAKGMVFDTQDPDNDDNLYVRVARQFAIPEAIGRVVRELAAQEGSGELGEFARDASASWFVLGEIYGHGVQDLGYSTPDDQHAKFRAYDVFVRTQADPSGAFLSREDMLTFCALGQIPTVPELWSGAWGECPLDALVNGKETVSTMQVHVREGVVIGAMIERMDERIGRAQLKAISAAYLTRKNATEYT